jgi:hypothetical protein
LNWFSNEIKINVNMLRKVMISRINNQMNCRLIVTQCTSERFNQTISLATEDRALYPAEDLEIVHFSLPSTKILSHHNKKAEKPVVDFLLFTQLPQSACAYAERIRDLLA